VIKAEKVGEAERGGTKKVFFQPIRTDTLELRFKLGGGALFNVQKACVWLKAVHSEPSVS